MTRSIGKGDLFICFKCSDRLNYFQIDMLCHLLINQTFAPIVFQPDKTLELLLY